MRLRKSSNGAEQEATTDLRNLRPSTPNIPKTNQVWRHAPVWWHRP